MALQIFPVKGFAPYGPICSIFVWMHNTFSCRRCFDCILRVFIWGTLELFRTNFLVHQPSWWEVFLLATSANGCSHNTTSLLSLIAGVEGGSSWTQKRVSKSWDSSVLSATGVWCTIFCWTSELNGPIISQPMLTREVSQASLVGLSSRFDIRCTKIQSPKSSLGTNMWRDFRILDISDTIVLSDTEFLICTAARSDKWFSWWLNRDRLFSNLATSAPWRREWPIAECKAFN